jgi:hypothetical protein
MTFIPTLCIAGPEIGEFKSGSLKLIWGEEAASEQANSDEET